MSERFFLTGLCGIAFVLMLGCQSRPKAVYHTRDASGLPIRMEVEEDEADEQVDRELVRRRMQEYRRRKGATVPTTGPSAAAAGPAFLSNGFDPFEERDCPPEGSATAAKKIAQNLLKNRIEAPHASDIDSAVTLAKLRKAGQDRDRWSSDRAATITAYIHSVKGTGKETCNCGVTDKKLTDTHIDVLSGPFDLAKPVIVEITPLWRLMHIHDGAEDWSSAAVRAKYEGHRVKITGWLFFDEAHLLEADNTDPGDKKGKKNWRRTCWEIHPVTKIELLP